MRRIRMIALAALLALLPLAAHAQSAIVEAYVKALGGNDVAVTKARADAVLASTNEAAGLSEAEYYDLVLDIAKSREQAGDGAGAEAAYKRALSFGEEAFGKDSLRLRAALQGIARQQAARSDALAAEKTLLKSKAIAEAELGEEHPSTRDELALLATLNLPVKPAPNGEDRRGDYESALLRIDERARQAGDIVAQGAGDEEGTCDSAADNAAEKIVVYYGTNRKRTGGNAPAWYYKNDYDRGAPVKLGVVTVSLPCDREIGSIPTQQLWKLEFRANPAKHVVLESVSSYPDETSFWASAKKRIDRSNRKEALVFIHGYNVDFAGAAMRTAQLAADTDLDGAPFFYDWPSKAALGGYNADRTIATEVPQITRDVANFLKGVADKTGAERISVIAHSMGNEPLIRALKLLADEDYKTRNDRPFDEVIFASPDVNVDNFKAHVTATRRLASNMTLYASEKDRALEYSSWRSDFPRAGFAREKVVVDGLVSVDTTKASSNFIGHDDFAGNGLDDLRSIIWFGAKPEGRCVLSPLASPKGIWDFSPKCEDADFRLAVTLLRVRGAKQAIHDLELTRAAAIEDTTISAAERKRRATRAEKIKALIRQVAAAFNPASLSARYAAASELAPELQLKASLVNSTVTNSKLSTASIQQIGIDRILHAHVQFDQARLIGVGVSMAPEQWATFAEMGSRVSIEKNAARGSMPPIEPIIDRADEQLAGPINVGAPAADRDVARIMDLYEDGKRIYESGRYAESISYFRRARELSETALGVDDELTINLLSWEATALNLTGMYRDAERQFLRILKWAERVRGDDHEDTFVAADNLAGVFQNQGRYTKAEPLKVQAVNGLQRLLGKYHPDTLIAVGNLANLYNSQGRHSDAERLFRIALSGFERALGENDPLTLGAVNNLASILQDQGKYSDAERMYLRAVKGFERRLGPNHPSTIIAINNLGTLYRLLGRMSDAQSLLQRALESQGIALGLDHPQILTIESNLAQILSELGNYEYAEKLIRRVLTSRTSRFGSDHPDTLISTNNLAVILRQQGRFDEAEPLYIRALDVGERRLGSQHDATQITIGNYFIWRSLAASSGYKSAWFGDGDALRLLGINLSALNGDLVSAADAARLVDPTSVESRSQQMLEAFALARSAGVKGSDGAKIVSDAAALSQRFNLSSVAAALNASSLKLADPKRRALLDERTRLGREIDDRYKALAKLQSAERRVPAGEASIQADIDGLAKEAAVITAQLRAGDQGQAEIDGVIVEEDLAKVGAALGAGEALIAYSSVGGRYLAFVTTRKGSTAVALDVEREEIAGEVSALRKGLRLPFTVRDGKEIASDNPGDLPAFDLGLAKKLHAQLIAPLGSHFVGVDRLVIVPDGPLQSLPFGVLVEKPAEASLKDMDRYKASTFLVDRYAVSMQPSVSAIRALRAKTPRAKGDLAMLGFADPVLSGKAATAQLVPLSGIGDARRLEDLPELPQMRSLLTVVGSALGARAEDLRFREKAEEADFRSLDAALPRYRMLTFATHGLVSNEIKALDLEEPALVMSLPPAKAGQKRPPENDGLLKASDIVGFEMDADLVILAACNTAAADGTPGAEPLSGLAKAFMAKGARALLVSHWQADANSSAVLIPATARYAEKDGFAVGLAKAQRDLKANAAYDPDPLSNTLHYAHPAIWAPFTLIGDPGR